MVEPERVEAAVERRAKARFAPSELVLPAPVFRQPLGPADLVAAEDPRGVHPGCA